MQTRSKPYNLDACPKRRLSQGCGNAAAMAHSIEITSGCGQVDR
ncbi:MAG: hypothetical protein ACREVY_11090 [Gammaproteobacteria bacterium]